MADRTAYGACSAWEMHGVPLPWPSSGGSRSLSSVAEHWHDRPEVRRISTSSDHPIRNGCAILSPVPYTREQLDRRNAWAAAWVEQRRQQAIAYLGGKCARCGTAERLEFDHRDRATKTFTITGNLNRRWEVLVQELDKCQLLCHDCHHAKTVECGEQGGGWNKKYETCPHGTTSGYAPPWNCRCEECRAARREYRRAYRQRVGK